MFYALLFLIPQVLTSLQDGSVAFTDCGSPSGHLDQIQVSGCDEGDSCIFKKGTTAQMVADFTSNVNSDVAKVKIQGIYHEIPLPFNLQPDNACGNYNVSCPLTPGSKQRMTIQLPIQTYYPNWAVTAKLQLIDSQGNDIFCVEFPAKITS